MKNVNLQKVAVLLVTTNEERHLSRFLNSLLNQSFKNITLYVFDNNSTDNSLEIVSKYDKEAQIIKSNVNVGYAVGNNIIAAKAIADGADFLFINNPDNELEENCIDALVKLINKDEKISMVSPIYFYGLNSKYQYKIQNYGGKIDFKKRHGIAFHSDQLFSEGTFPKEIEVNLIGGGITFIKASVVKEIGLFDERYYIYGEEADLAFRSYRAGYKMMATSDAKVWHHHDWSKKNKKQHYFSYFYMNRAKVLYFIKYKFFNRLAIMILSEIFQFPLKIKWSLKTADIKLLKFYYLGLIHGILNKQNKSYIKFE